jgi:acetate CoA/acetoacetate CoA-transferase alpha subunit
MPKPIGAAQAAELIQDGMTVMVGGFLCCGTPESLVDALVRRGARNLTIIANDTGLPGRGVAKLIESGLVSRVIVSHIGRTPLTGRMMGEGTLDVTLVPQGTLAERVRAGGAGLGGFLTQTGLGTDVANGKQIVTAGGMDYLLELPLRADVALLRASLADERGNLTYKGTTRNFNPLMAAAADVVIAAAEKIVPAGDIPGEQVVTPGIFVDYLVGGEPA